MPNFSRFPDIVESNGWDNSAFPKILFTQSIFKLLLTVSYYYCQSYQIESKQITSFETHLYNVIPKVIKCYCSEDLYLTIINKKTQIFSKTCKIV